ncbi:MAG: transposase family protein [Ghiorsea sp.]|nr:transposase family protein [Ghiorsea sp.]
MGDFRRTVVKQHIENEKKLNPLKRRGLKSSRVSLQDCILLALYYIRHYPTFQVLGNIFGIQESYCHKVYSRYLRIIANVEKLPSRLDLIDNKRETLIVDVSEQPIERPVKHQKQYYSGKKKRHTIKAQIIACATTGKVLSVVCAKGKKHDFSVFKESRLPIHPNSKLLADSGYQGLKKYHDNSMTPIKKQKGVERSKEDKSFNKSLSKKRILLH